MADDFVRVRFFGDGVVDFLFVRGKVERGEDAGFARAGRLVARGK